MNRREFARLFAVGGSAALFVERGLAWNPPALPASPPAVPDEAFWTTVRQQFVMPPDLGVMNAANLCPSSVSALEAMYANTKDMDRDPSFNNRTKMTNGKEDTRRLLADFLRVTQEEIVITRNTSESNNLVSSGLDLKQGDEVVLFSDNHPSNNAAWREKAKRFGFSVVTVDQINPHPGTAAYVEAFSRAITPRTKVLAFTHLTNTVGDLLPARELCQLARERGVLSLLDGAQSFGLLDVNLSVIQPDFYSGSAHKWPCGPKEVGVLYVNKAVHDRIWPSVVSAGAGPIGISKKLEGFGQRDEPAIIGFGEALKFQTKIGREAIQTRSQALAKQLMDGLKAIDGVKLWTSADPSRYSAVVTFQPAGLDVTKLSNQLYEKDKIGCATRGGNDRPGIRLSPHFYNLPSEVDRVVSAIRRYVGSGVSA